MNATSVWREPLVQWLIKQHAGRPPERIIEDYVNARLRESSQSQLPVKVELITSLLGIKRRVADYPFAGRIYAEESGQLVMDLKAADSLPRQRFTCGHELIHTAFPGFRVETRYRMDMATGQHHNPARSEEEYLCDLGASLLLMPQALTERLFNIDGGLGDVEELAEHAEVSLEAAGNRLVKLSARPAAFLVLDVTYKPADMRAIRTGEPVEPKLRVRYATLNKMETYIPRYKSVEASSVYARALSETGIVAGVDLLPTAEAAGRFLVEAKYYPYSSGDQQVRRVLAVARSTPN
jgi:Zn-dependent peptidase ImmA (M78 family)